MRHSLQQQQQRLASVSPKRSRSGASDAPTHASNASNFTVVLRVRPPIARELSNERKFRNIVHVDRDERIITLSENLSSSQQQNDIDRQIDAHHSAGDDTNSDCYGTHVFTFDRVYNEHATQAKVYETTARDVVESALQGYNSTIFAYGQTGTGMSVMP